MVQSVLISGHQWTSRAHTWLNIDLPGTAVAMAAVGFTGDITGEGKLWVTGHTGTARPPARSKSSSDNGGIAMDCSEVDSIFGVISWSDSNLWYWMLLMLLWCVCQPLDLLQNAEWCVIGILGTGPLPIGATFKFIVMFLCIDTCRAYVSMLIRVTSLLFSISTEKLALYLHYSFLGTHGSKQGIRCLAPIDRSLQINTSVVLGVKRCIC